MCTTRSTEHTARRSLMHNCVTSHLWLKSALHASSHPCMCTCVLCLGCFLLISPVFYFVPPFSFQPFLMFTSEFNERSRSSPLCDFRLETVATSDHETPLTRTSGKPASLRLSGTLAESTLSDKTKGAGEMVVRFPTIRRLAITGSAFSRELRANSP